MSKPNVLVLGGVGFIGRNFVKYLVDNNLAAKIRVVDKVLPAIAFLGKDHQEAFNNPIVEFMQGNLTSAGKKKLFILLAHITTAHNRKKIKKLKKCTCKTNIKLIICIIKESVARIYTIPGGKFNFVFNLAAETKYGQTDAVCMCIILHEGCRNNV